MIIKNLKIRQETTIRHFGLILWINLLRIFGALICAFLIPRLMGTETYGKYVLMISIVLWFIMLSGFGFSHMIARYAPDFILEKDHLKLKRFCQTLLTGRFIAGILVALIFTFCAKLWLKDYDDQIVTLVSLIIVIRTLVHLLFDFFLGMNQPARWVSGDMFRQWLYMGCVILGFLLGDLKGSFLGIFTAEILILIIGIRYTRTLITWNPLNDQTMNIRSHLLFGRSYYISTLLLATFQRCGEVTIQMTTHNYAEVGFFNLPFSLYILISHMISQITSAFIPLFIKFHSSNQNETLKIWIERIIKALTIFSMLLVFGLLMLGRDLILLLLGSSYKPVATNLIPLAAIFLLVALNRIGYILTIVYKRPKEILYASSIRIVIFWIVGIPLIIHFGSFGACLAIFVASVAFGLYLTVRMRAILHYSLKPWFSTIGIGIFFLPLLMLKSTPYVNGLLYITTIMGYLTILFHYRIFTSEELSSIWKTIRSGKWTPKMIRFSG